MNRRNFLQAAAALAVAPVLPAKAFELPKFPLVERTLIFPAGYFEEAVEELTRVLCAKHKMELPRIFHLPPPKVPRVLSVRTEDGSLLINANLLA